jgi:hypothetical protein
LDRQIIWRLLIWGFTYYLLEGNLVARKHIAIVVLVCAVAVIVAGRAALNFRDYVRDLEGFHQREMQDWVVAQRGAAYRLDMAVAEALVANDAQTLAKALTEASEAAYKGREAIWRTSLVSGVNAAVDRWGFRSAYESAGSYLYYLSSKDNRFPLAEVEVQNLELIRTYAEAFFTGFSEVLTHIVYEEEISPGMMAWKYRPWQKIIHDDTMVAKIDDFGSDYNLLPPIGDRDASYRAFLDARRVGVPDLQHGLAYSGEPIFDEEALAERTERFLKAIGAGDLSNAEAPDPVTGRTDVTEGGGRAINGFGEDRYIGEYLVYGVKDREAETTYEVEITHIGAHISRLEVRQWQSGGSMDEAIATGQDVLTQWAAYEGVTLELTQTHLPVGDNYVYFVYAVVIEDVVANDQLITLEISLDSGQSLRISLDAFKYFTRYNYPHNYSPELTGEEAVAALSPQLTAAGVPRMEIQRGTNTLVYAIPVKGVKWVDRVYINAVTGAYEGMEYDYTRP